MPPLNPAGGGSIPLDEDNTSDDDEDDDNEDDDVDDDELVIHPGDRWMILALACMVMFGVSLLEGFFWLLFRGFEGKVSGW